MKDVNQITELGHIKPAAVTGGGQVTWYKGMISASTPSGLLVMSPKYLGAATTAAEISKAWCQAVCNENTSFLNNLRIFIGGGRYSRDYFINIVPSYSSRAGYIFSGYSRTDDTSLTDIDGNQSFTIIEEQ